MTHILDTEQMTTLLRVAGAASVLVLVAMSVDLCAGLRKAALRGEARTSYALRRSVTKFILYEGGLVIALGVDMLLHFARVYDLLGLGALLGVPIVTCSLGILILVVEGLSVYEKADRKTRLRARAVVHAAEDTIHHTLTTEQVAEIAARAVAEAVRRQQREAEEKGRPGNTKH